MRLQKLHQLPFVRWAQLKAFVAVMALLQVLFNPVQLLGSDSNCLSGVCPNESLFNLDRNLDLVNIENKIKSLATWFFGVGTVYFIAMVWKNGLALAKSGDNPQARAQAQAALWANALGGVIFFGAAIFAAVISKFVQN